MKLFVASDLHGSACYCEKMLEAYERSAAGRMLLLGDLLYHGPRNDLPEDYRPKEVIRMLNEHSEEIWAVRGNCEAEVDQMVLDFPVMADYGVMMLGKMAVYATHGHLWNENALPPIKKGDALLYGHTHLYRACMEKGIYFLNPGSAALPKGGNEPTYAMLTEEKFSVYSFDDRLKAEMAFFHSGRE